MYWIGERAVRERLQSLYRQVAADYGIMPLPESQLSARIDPLFDSGWIDFAILGRDAQAAVIRRAAEDGRSREKVLERGHGLDREAHAAVAGRLEDGVLEEELDLQLGAARVALWRRHEEAADRDRRENALLKEQYVQ